MSPDIAAPEELLLAPRLIQLLGAWWYNYDEWNADVLRDLIVDEMTFNCRTDSGTTDYEAFVRASITGADNVMAWQKDHRMNSPYPLRHNCSNVHVVATKAERVEFASYIFVTKIVGGRPHSLSSGTACGVAVRNARGLLLQRLDVMLDTTDSVTMAERTDHVVRPV